MVAAMSLDNSLACQIDSYVCQNVPSIFVASVIRYVDYFVPSLSSRQAPHRRLFAMHLELRERIHIRAASVAAGVLPADISRIDPVRGSCSISFWYNGVKIISSYPRDYRAT